LRVPARGSMLPLLVMGLAMVPMPWTSALLVKAPPLRVAPRPLRMTRPLLVKGWVTLREPPVEMRVPPLAMGARRVPAR